MFFAETRCIFSEDMDRRLWLTFWSTLYSVVVMRWSKTQTTHSLSRTFLLYTIEYRQWRSEGGGAGVRRAPGGTF